MNRRTFLKTTAGTTASFIAPSIWSAEPKAEPSDAELLARSRERIARHRQADGVIALRDAEGKAVPGAQVKVEQTRHAFLFGCNFFRFGRINDPGREEEYRQRFDALLNYATLGFYWGAYERARGEPMYDYTDQVLDWCHRQGIICKGHPLAWDHDASSPRWLPEDMKVIERLSVARVRESVERFKGRINLWDVVNEPTDLTRFKNRMNEFARGLGAVPYTRLHLDVAREANPEATLMVNDYRTDPAFYEILDALRDDGKLLFDAVGIQSHMHGGGWPLPKIWEVCDRFARLRLPVHFTETTVVSGQPGWERPRPWPTTPEGEARQAEYVAKFYTMLFAHPAVEAITWWDFSDDGAWQGAPAGFLRPDMSPKPAYNRLKDLIKGQWWTDTAGATDATGEFRTRAFLGRHRLTATLPGGRTVSREVTWDSRADRNRFELA